LVAHFEEVVIILDALQAVAVRDLVLVQKDLAGALKRRWNDEAAASVVEGGEDDRGRAWICSTSTGEEAALRKSAAVAFCGVVSAAVCSVRVRAGLVSLLVVLARRRLR
jgi:hypothetical protein